VEQTGFGDPLEPRPDELSGGATDVADMKAVVERLSIGVDNMAEYRFSDVVQAALDTGSFERLMEGREKRDEHDRAVFVLESGPRSILAGILGDGFGGRTFQLEDGRVVRWGMRGKNRGKRYQVVVVAGG
jgi:hypothetical protein